MNNIKKILKSILVGIGSITPGVSGSMIATSFNIYEELIDALVSFPKKPFKALISIWQYILGIVVGLIVGFLVIAKLLEVIPLQITIFFIGLIVGSLPEMIKSNRDNKKKWYHYLIMIFAILIILSLTFLPKIDVVNASGVGLYLIYILVGFLVAIPLIIPGLSGATILMIIGLYTYLTDTVRSTLELLFNLEFISFFKSSMPLLIILLSAIIGLLVFAKVIKYLMNNHKISFTMAVIGLVLIAPVNIFIELFKDYKDALANIDALTIIVSIILLVIGFTITFLIGGQEGGSSNEQQENI